MGIVRRQGGKHAIVQYLGVIIGAFSTLFVYPLNQDLYGFAQFLIGTSLLLYPLMNLGIHMVVTKYFPRYSQTPEQSHTFFGAGLCISILLFFLVASILLWAKSDFIHVLTQRNFGEVYLLDEYYVTLLLLAFAVVLTVMLRSQAINYHRIVVPYLISEFSLKIFLPIVIAASLIWPIQFEFFSCLFVGYNVVIVLLMLYYLIRIRAFSLTSLIPFDFDIKGAYFQRSVVTYSLFSSLNRMGSLLAFRIDAFMITLLLGASSNGLYYVILFIANVIQIPYKSINQISIPLISNAWEQNDVAKIDRIYKRSASSLTLVGLALFLFLWFSLSDILLLSPKSDQLQAGVQLFFFLGIAKVTDSLTSVNEPILTYSPHYKFSLFFILLLGILNVFLNYYFIGEFGLVGAAMATCLAYIIYNFLKLVFLYVVYRLHPVSKDLIYLLALAVICCLTLLGISMLALPWLRVLLNGLAVFGTFVLPGIFFRLSPDMNEFLVILSGKVPFVGKSIKEYLKKVLL